MDNLKNWFVGTTFDFVGWRYHAAVFSLLLVLASWVGFFVVGPNYGIDFTGGTEIHLKFEKPVEIGEVRQALGTLGLSGDAIQQMGTTEAYEFKVRIQDPDFGVREVREELEKGLHTAFGADAIAETAFNSEVGARFAVTFTPAAAEQHKLTPAVIKAALGSMDVANVATGREDHQFVVTLPGLAEQIQANIQGALGDRKFEVLEIDAVGPKVGADLQRQGFISLMATLALVLVYVAFRFDIGFAPGAILALFHDASVTVGFFVLFQREFNLPMIGALLTIVGYSINDTIVIYDRIRENQERYRRKDLKELINVSINETLTRTISTSATTLMAIAMFLILGGPVIRDFALAMTIGIVFGSYSTIYVAVPMILLMEDVKPWLSRFIAVQAPSAPPAPPVEGDDVDPDAGLSESEKRRRAREREQGV